jgi:hypothetical protein
MEPTIFHVTHWKAGSSWVRRSLRRTARERFVNPSQRTWDDPFDGEIRPGRIYSMYATREQVEAMAPPGSRRFVIVRNLRSTLVSGYFDFRDTHPDNDFSESLRERLRSLSEEDGLLYLMDWFLPRCAEIQDSWGDEAMRYERLVKHPNILRKALREMGLRGLQLEEPNAPETRWRPHFTDQVAEEFDARFRRYGSR